MCTLQSSSKLLTRRSGHFQKEVKSRIQIIKEGIDKLEDRLRLPVVPDSPQPPAPPVPETIPPMKLQVQEQKEERRVSRRRSSSREKSEEKEKTKKKKKKKSKVRNVTYVDCLKRMFFHT